jgi:hypothetical protein
MNTAMQAMENMEYVRRLLEENRPGTVRRRRRPPPASSPGFALTGRDVPTIYVSGDNSTSTPGGRHEHY